MRKLLRTGRLKFEVYSQRQSINQYAPTVVIRLIIHNVQKMIIECAPASVETRMIVIVFFLLSMVLYGIIFSVYVERPECHASRSLPTYLPSVPKISTQQRQCIVRPQKLFLCFLSKFTVTPISTVPSVRYVPRYAVSAVKLRQDLEGA